MDKLTLYEEIYQEIVEKMTSYPFDTSFQVDLDLLKELEILSFQDKAFEEEDVMHSFHVFEAQDKVTLINEEFVVWICPKQTPQGPATYVVIALNNRPAPVLELVFTASGVYNRSGIVLKVLNRLLQEIHENERMMTALLRNL